MHDGVALELDLYQPTDAAAPTPLIVYIHGGGWEAYNKDNPRALPLVRRGYAVASINYRLSGQAPFPAQIEDCKAAVRFLRVHAEQYNLDSDSIGAWGDSAGGHLAAMLGLTGGQPAFERGGHCEQSSAVQAVCDWYGPTDLLAAIDQVPAYADHPDRMLWRFIGGSLRENPDKAAAANPIAYVRPDAPPFLIMHGDADDIVPLSQSEMLRDALQAAGVETTMIVIPGAGHGFSEAQGLPPVETFFDRHLRANL